jgi:hypothetical protein
MAPIAFRWARFSLLSCLPREKTTDTHYSPFLGSPEMSDKLRYEWHCWADVRTNDVTHVRTTGGRTYERRVDARTNDGNARTNDAHAVQTILWYYYIWTQNVCLCPCPAQTLNNTFGAKNSSTFSTAPDDPSSIWTNIHCTCALIIIHPISKNPITNFGNMFSHLIHERLKPRLISWHTLPSYNSLYVQESQIVRKTAL